MLSTHRGKNERDGWNGHWVEHVGKLNAFIVFVLEPNRIDPSFDNTVLV